MNFLNWNGRNELKTRLSFWTLNTKRKDTNQSSCLFFFLSPNAEARTCAERSEGAVSTLACHPVRVWEPSRTVERTLVRVIFLRSDCYGEKLLAKATAATDGVIVPGREFEPLCHNNRASHQRICYANTGSHYVSAPVVWSIDFVSTGSPRHFPYFVERILLKTILNRFKLHSPAFGAIKEWHEPTSVRVFLFTWLLRFYLNI